MAKLRRRDARRALAGLALRLAARPIALRLLALVFRLMVERRWGNVVEIIADRLQGNAEKNLHNLLLAVTRVKKGLNGLRFGIAAFVDQFSHQSYEGIEL